MPHSSFSGPAMPYKAAEDYEPATPAMKESRFSGRRFITGAPRRLSLREMRESILADHPDATDIRRAGHSRSMFRIGGLYVFRYHATNIATWNPSARRLTFSAHRETGTAGLGWHTPSTRNAWADAVPALLGAEWQATARGGGHNASVLSLRGPGGFAESVSIIGRNAAVFDLPEA